jgi:hypothetical protein
MIFDGSYVDIASIGSAVLAPFVKPCRACWHRRKEPEFRLTYDRFTIGVDILHGASLVPFAVLIGCVFSSELLKEAVQSNRVFFGIAGLLGIAFLAGEIGKLRS